MSTPVENQKTYDPKNSEYFNNLPLFVQETIIQSTDQISNDAELKDVADKIMGGF